MACEDLHAAHQAEALICLRPAYIETCSTYQYDNFLMQNYSISPIEMFSSCWRNRNLIKTMTKREVIGRYRGSVVGIAWSFFNPLLMLAIYTFVFSVVFKARWGVNVEESKIDFAFLLFVGLIMHGLFAECVNKAPDLILSNVNYVKKVIFPLDIFPCVVLGAALFNTLISIAVLVLAQLILNQHLPWTLIFLPFVLLPLIFATLGFTWFISALCVFIRDVGQLTGMFTTVLLFLSAVFYPVSALPEKYQWILQLNPLVLVIEESRKVLIFSQVPDIRLWGSMLILSLLIAWLGFAWFQKTRKGFSDVL